MDFDFVLNSEDMIQMCIKLVSQFVDLDALTHNAEDSISLG